MTKVEQIKKALWYAEERDMVFEFYELMRVELPNLLEAVEALKSLEQTVRYLPLGIASIKACENARAAMEKLQ